MRFQHLDLNLLVALNALLSECSVSQAAERLNITQPAMSHALNRLRLHFDDKLLVPAGRKLRLTPRAESLVHPLRLALLQIESLVSGAADFDPVSSKHHVAMLASDYSLSVQLAQAIGRMKMAAPGMSFEVTYPDQPLLKLERGEADLVILPEQYLLPDHPYLTLFEDDYVLVVWSGSSLAGEHIDMDRYFDAGHVAVRFGMAMQPKYAEDVTLALPRARRVELVSRTQPLTIKPMPCESPPIVECVQWSRLRANDAALAWVVNQLRGSGRG